MAFFAALGVKAAAPFITKAIVATAAAAVGVGAYAAMSHRNVDVQYGPMDPVDPELEEILRITRTTTNRRHEDEPGSDQAEQNWQKQEKQSDLNKQAGGGRQGGGKTARWGGQRGGQQGGGQQGGEHQGGGQQGGGQEAGGDQGNEDGDSEDENSNQESEDSESEEETDDKKNKKTGGRRKVKRYRKSRAQHQDHSGVSSNNEGSIQNFPAAVLMGLLNVRSLNNKVHRILKLILQNRLNVVCTTETWSKEDTGDAVLRRASPEDFRFCYQARSTRGGGAAIQVSPVLQSVQILFNCETTTFEVAATVLQHEEWDEPVLVISLYRRGASGAKFHKFLDEFQDILAEVFNLCNNVVVTGDFNVWFEDLRRGRRFRCLLQAFELDQHVREPTHRRGHTLDLVITRNVEVSGLFVHNDGISDHYSVYFSARPGSKIKRQKTKEKSEEDEDEEENRKQHKKKKE